MKLSIVTASFNAAGTIGDSIQSLERQTYRDVEHIIIDGGSVDGTVLILKECSNKVSKWISEPDQGIYDAMNKGIELASGDIIGTLNADDLYYDQDVLQNVASAMRDSSIDACYSDLVYVDRHDLNKLIRYWRSCQYEPGIFKQGWVPAHPTFFVRKRVYDRYGGFDLHYKLAADFELMARLLEFYKIRALYIPKIFVKMRVGGATNKSYANIIRQNLEILSACKKNHINISILSFLMTKLIARLHQYYLREAT